LVACEPITCHSRLHGLDGTRLWQTAIYEAGRL